MSRSSNSVDVRHHSAAQDRDGKMLRICELCGEPILYLERSWTDLQHAPGLTEDFLGALARASGRERSELCHAIWMRSNFLTIGQRYQMRDICRNRMQYVRPIHVERIASLLYPELPGGILIRPMHTEEGACFHPRLGRLLVCAECASRTSLGSGRMRLMKINRRRLWE